MAERTNNRYKDLTDDIRIGYNYIKDKFYVSNKGSITYRSSISDIQKVLHSLEIYYVTDDTFQSFKDTMEEITDLYYTLSDTGSYIASIQFNDFSDYPLTIDCEKGKIFITNSTTIYDLRVKESPKVVRIPKLCSFYKEVLGLNISKEDMTILYDLLTAYYKPTCYVQLEKRENKEDPLYYGNSLILSNYSETANMVYNWRYNPLNKTTPTDIGNIISINANTNTITLNQPINPDIIEEYGIKEGSSILIYGTEIKIGNDTFTCDGTYAVSDINSNIITVSDTIPCNYTFPYYTCSFVSDTYSIVSMSRDTNSIEIEETPNNIIIGNTICVLGADIDETISCNGVYTVNNVQDNTIYVEEPIPTNFTGLNAKVYKEAESYNIEKIENKTIYLLSSDITLNQDKVIVYNNNINEIYTVSEQTHNTVTVIENIENYISEYPKLQYPIPSNEVEVNVTYTKEQYEEKYPLGSFILDSPEQAREYVLASFTVIPPMDIIHLPYKKYQGYIDIKLYDIGNITMKFIGLENEISKGWF